MTPVEDLFSIKTGYTFRGGVAQFKSGETAIVQSSDISSGLSESIARLEFDIPRGSELQGRDVLLTARGGFKAAVVPANMLPAVTLSSVLVLRPLNRTTNSDYVAVYLNSSHGQAALHRLVTSGSVATLRKVDLSDLKIPLPSPDRQRAIADLGHNINQQICNHHLKIKKLQQLQNEVILNEIGDIR